MPLQPGTTLGPYEILSPLGAGGMGEVYKARDTRLDRTVAIKVLPDHVAADPDLKQRFEREAKTISSLNHPHICTLYDIGEQDGVDFLVMEYLESDTLAQRLERGALPLDQALKVAIEIADALDKAHRQGIVHRDLKPGNIMLTKSGAKLLDFGLAKMKPAGAGFGESAFPTKSASLTQEGTILGTLQYMAPEQVEGQDADTRTDIFAFGTVVYEMVTGRKAFEGKSQASLIAAIMHVDPPALSTLQSITPPALDLLVKTCLAKDPDERWQSVGDVGRQIRMIREAGSRTDVPAVVATGRPTRQWLSGAVAGGVLAAVATGLVAWTLTRPDVIPAAVARFDIVLPDDAPIADGNHSLAISPDGTQIVYAGRGPSGPQLYLRPIDQLVGAPLRGGEGGSGPSISPDGEWVGFVASQRSLKKVSFAGGEVITVAESSAGILGAAWHDDEIIFGSFRAGLFRVSADGGEPEALTTLDEGELGHGWPTIIPGRAALVFVTTTSGVQDAELAVLDLVTGEITRLGLAGLDPHYVSTGHLVYAGVDGAVRAVPFDTAALDVTGVPVLLVEGVGIGGGAGADFSVSDTGRLVYALDTSRRVERSLVWVERDGREELLAAPSRRYGVPRISPDGTRILLGDGENDISVWNIADETLTTRSRVAAKGDARGWSPAISRLAVCPDQAARERP